MSKKKSSASIPAERPIPGNKERGKSGGKTEEKMAQKHELILSGDASPITTLRYIIDKLEHILNTTSKPHAKESSCYQLYADVTPVTLFTENKSSARSKSRVNDMVMESAHQIDLHVNHNQMKHVFELEMSIADKPVRSAAELLMKLNEQSILLPTVSQSRPYTLPTPLGYLVAVVFPSCIGRIRLRKSERVFPMALVPVSEKYSTSTDGPKWKWSLMTVQCQNRYFSARFWVPSDKVGISIEQLLTEFVLWTYHRRPYASSDKEREAVELIVNNVMEKVSVSPLTPIGPLPDIVTNLYTSLEGSERLPKGFATTTAEIPESRVLVKIANRIGNWQ